MVGREKQVSITCCEFPAKLPDGDVVLLLTCFIDSLVLLSAKYITISSYRYKQFCYLNAELAVFWSLVWLLTLSPGLLPYRCNSESALDVCLQLYVLCFSEKHHLIQSCIYYYCSEQVVDYIQFSQVSAGQYTFPVEQLWLPPSNRCYACGGHFNTGQHNVCDRPTK